MSSDESTLQQFFLHQRYVRSSPGKRGFDKRKNCKHNHVNCWGVWFIFIIQTIAHTFPGDSTYISWTLQQLQMLRMYLQLLQNKSEIHVHIHARSVFMHDAAPCMNSKELKEGQLYWNDLATAFASLPKKIFGIIWKIW